MTTNLVLILIILFQIKRIDSLFVSVGDYSNESIPGLNAPECGLGLKPLVFELSFNIRCFRNKYQNKTIVLFDKTKVNPKINQRVYKGVDVRNVYESPWVVFVASTQWFRVRSSCTGVLISPFWLLTAAHCFSGLKNDWMPGFVLTMGSNTRKGIQRIHVEPQYFYIHPGYTNPDMRDENIRGPGPYDIALIRVSGFYPNTTHDNTYLINTICLPKRGEVNDVSENASFYGYGHINQNQDITEYLQKGWVTLNPFRACAYKYFCGFFTDDNPRPCKGDSGGPLVQFVPGVEKRAVLLGTMSAVGPDASCNNLTKYGNWIPVSKHIDWILNTMKENYP